MAAGSDIGRVDAALLAKGVVIAAVLAIFIGFLILHMDEGSVDERTLDTKCALIESYYNIPEDRLLSRCGEYDGSTGLYQYSFILAGGAVLEYESEADLTAETVGNVVVVEEGDLDGMFDGSVQPGYGHDDDFDLGDAVGTR